MRVDTLTGMRGIAALSVMLYHLPQQPAFAAFRMSLFDRAYLCVDLFFVLSGFVMAIGYRDMMAALPSARRYRDFLRHRLARVFPLHLVVTLAFLLRALVDMSGDGGRLATGDVVANLVMIQSWGLGTTALAGNSWSVSTECVAYLLFPLLAIGVRSRWWQAAAMGAAALLLLVALSGLGVRGPMDVVQRDSILPVLRCLGGFILGMLAQRFAGHPILRGRLDGDAALVVVCTAIALALLIPGGDLIVVLLLPLLILCCSYEGRLARTVLANPVAMRLGIISYSLYLWHPLLRDIAARSVTMVHGRGIVQYDTLAYAALILVTILFCECTYRFVEVPGRRLILRRTPRVAGSAQEAIA
jgi:peptidoglycan/LPS O-acetylase OafA/YrhL